MDTETARHETEESLTLARLGFPRQTDSANLQNGKQSPEAPCQQANGEGSWTRFQPGTGDNPMKRHQDSCVSPADTQGPFDQGPYETNGLSEQCVLGLHQPKRLRMNREEVLSLWDKKETEKESRLDLTGELNKPEPDKTNCNYPNGDIFTLSRSKQVSTPNGATTVTPPSGEGPTGALLEKTLSQYYPEQVSIAPQTSSSQADRVTSNLQEQGIPSPSLTSGFHILASEPFAKTLPEVASRKGYSPAFMVNGYSRRFGAEQQHQPPPYPLSDLPDLEARTQANTSKGPGVAAQTSVGDRSQDQNSTECFPRKSEGLCVIPKSGQVFVQESYPLPALQMGTSVPGKGSNAFGSFDSPAVGDHVSGNHAAQQNLQFGRQQHHSEVPRPADRSSQGLRDLVMPAAPPLSPQQRQSVEPQTRGGRPDPPAIAEPQKPGGDCKLSLTGQAERLAGNEGPCPQTGWIDLNASQAPQHPGSQPHMWRGFPPQQSPVPQSPSRLLEPEPTHSFTARGFGQPSFPQQQDHHTQNGYKPGMPPTQTQLKAASECHPCKTPSGVHVQSDKFQHMPEQCNSSQQQMNQQFCSPVLQEKLCKHEQDLERMLSPDFLLQRPPQAHQQQDSISQLQSAQGLKMAPQSLDLSQGQVDAQLQSRHKTEGYMQSKISSPSYQPPKLPGPTHPGPGHGPAMRSNIPDPPHPSSQPLSKDMESVFGFSDIAEMQKNPQRRYTLSPSAPLQYSHQSLNHRLPGNVDCLQALHSQTQPQLPGGADGPQMPFPKFPKAETQDPCAHFQRGPLRSPGPQGDLQRHAALRMRLLQKQERPSHSQSPDLVRPDLQAAKRENGQMLTSHMTLQAGELVSGMLATVKQERPSSACEQNQHKSILATMEQQLQQYQPSPVFEGKPLVIKPPGKVKVEMAGSVTVVSTNMEDHKPADFTPKKVELQSFLESPMKLLDTPIKNLLDTPVKTQYDIPPCHCVEQIIEKDEGPYYTHLGAAPNIKAIRETMEKRSGLTGGAIRIEKVVYTGKEGKSTQGCPIAKWVIRRANVDEKLLVLVRERAGHSCETACIVVVMLIWEGIPTSLADHLYTDLIDTLTKHGTLTNRRCALNEERTCACQGLDQDVCGASFSFGCSWSMYYNGCKFARSKVPRKFKLLGDDPKEEEKLESHFQGLATLIAPTYKKMAPEAYANQVEHEHRASDCRLGLKEGRPFSGVTACLDFCAHSHRDLHNMQGGSTVVCTLTREDNRQIGKIPEDEQLHVLPLYKASSTDEFGSVEGQLEKTRTGAIQVLSVFRRQVRMLAEPAKSCRQKKLESRKAAVNKPSHPNTPNAKADNAQQAKQMKQTSYESIAQNTPPTGTDPGHIGAAHPTVPTNQPQQQKQSSAPRPFSSPSSPANYPTCPNAPGSYASTSKQTNIFPQPASSYHSSLPLPNTYMNGSNPPSPYSRPLTPNSFYPGYQCNGSVPVDNYHPFYSNPKHLDMYQQQRPSLYPEQQFTPHQSYGVSYPPRYGEPTLPVSAYGNCNMRPSIHHMAHYPGYSTNRGPEAQFLEALSRPPSTHPGLDYAVANKCSQFGRYPNAYLAQNPQMFPPNLDPLKMKSKPELNLQGANGIPQTLPPLSSECLNQSPGMGLPNGNVPPTMIKQEPCTAMPVPEEKEEVWSDNEHNFLDPEIGGVAVAPSHGSILIECAKRELHATTPIKKPDRAHPTRVSLVFYQHKNLNEAKHGLALWEAKMAEKAREKEEDSEKHGADSTPSKSGGRKVKREHPEPSETSEPTYKRFIQMLAEKSQSCTTNTYVGSAPYAFTKVTGPYSHFL
ncbi:methylcytosine dioxygenase TET2 [Electrophorus electricus]|uniref:methylcytosine dioxygenase TET2 n=1 Tax=Electrophorus electricus TaxID=8005 RepID=UPI0015CF9A36|nr:methylcytosine dioxygenase TET2 [Electrophorus electricus]